jgi:hypothetical protein
MVRVRKDRIGQAYERIGGLNRANLGTEFISWDVGP